MFVKFIKARAVWVPLVFLAGIVLVGAASWIGFPYGAVAWLADLAASWMLLGAVLAVYAALRSPCRWPFRVGLGLLTALLVMLFASPRLPGDGQGESFQLISANVHLENSDLAPLKRWVAEVSPDAVLLQEVSPAAAAELALWTDWPHRIVIPDSTPFGIAVLSKHPLLAQPVPTDAAQTPAIRVVVGLPWGRVPLSAVHPMPPISAEYHRLRDALLVREGAWLRAQGGGVLAGDLNATPWSSALHRASEVGLRRAGSMEPTWPGYPMLGITVDHVLATEGWCREVFAVGPRIGSDHLPVAASLRRCDA